MAELKGRLTERQTLKGKAHIPLKGDTGDKGDKGEQGEPGKDGVSATHEWNGTVLTVTSASGTSSADLKGEKGDKGDMGAQGEKGDPGEKGEQGIQGIQGEPGADGAKGDKGDKGDPGATGADGTSVTVASVSESAEDGGSNVVTFSDGKTITIKNGSKGSAGAPGIQGATGATGPAGVDGDDYVLTASDKAEIAEMVENATIVQSPKYVNTVEEMTDTNRPYVLIKTGRIWANAEVTVEKEVTKNIPLEGITDSSRLGSDGSVQTGTGYAAYCVTPFIDLLAYPVPFTLHLDGGAFIPVGTTDSYTRIYSYTEARAKISGGNHTSTTIDSTLNINDSDVVVDSNGNASITFTKTPTTNNANNDGVLRYIRISGKGSSTASSVYVTYEETEVTTGVQWFDTGTTYAPTLTAEEKQAMVEEVASMVDAQLLSVIGDGVVTV